MGMNTHSPTPVLSNQSGRRRRRRGAIAALSLALLASACGSDGTSAPSAGDAEATTAETESAEQSPSEAGGDSANGDAAGSAVASFAYTAPDGMEPHTIGVSPSGDRVAVGFEAPPTAEATPGQVVVYEADSGTELWRVEIDDVGIAGIGKLIFTDGGVSFAKLLIDESALVTLNDGAVIGDITLSNSSLCNQFLNGVVDRSASVYFTVVPGGVCRVDVSDASTIELSGEDFAPAAVMVNSIRWDAEGALVVSYSDEDFVSFAATIDPVSFTVIETNQAAAEPQSAADRYGSQLEEGLVLSAEARTAQSPDGSTAALLQPGRVDVIR